MAINTDLLAMLRHFAENGDEYALALMKVLDSKFVLLESSDLTGLGINTMPDGYVRKVTIPSGPGHPTTEQTIMSEVPRSFNIIAIGDGNIAGSSYIATDTPGNPVGPMALASPLDEMWNGTAVAPFFAANSGINVATNCTDSRCTDAAASNKASFLSMIPEILRRAYPLRINGLRFANLGIPGSSISNWVGEPAKAEITFAQVPAADDTVTVGEATYTFKVAAVEDYEVTIGGDVAASAANLRNAINHEGNGFTAATPINANCFCPLAASNGVLTVYALLPGVAGNELAISSVAGARVTTSAAFTGGSATSAIYTNARALIPSSGFGPVDAVIVFVGAQDAAATGDRGRASLSNVQNLLLKIETDFPDASILLCLPPASGNATAQTAAGVIATNMNILTATHPRVDLVDLYSVGVGSADVAVIMIDNLHLTYYGCSIAAQLLSDALAQALSIPIPALPPT